LQGKLPMKKEGGPQTEEKKKGGRPKIIKKGRESMAWKGGPETVLRVYINYGGRKSGKKKRRGGGGEYPIKSGMEY